MNVCNAKNNYADYICFHTKTPNKKRIEQRYCFI